MTIGRLSLRLGSMVIDVNWHGSTDVIAPRAAHHPLSQRVRFLLLAITELFFGVGLEAWLEFVLKVKMAG